MSNPASITLAQLFRFYRGLPHQSAAITQLERDLLVNGYETAMRRDREWFHVWSQDGKQPEPEPAPAPARATSALLKVPYFSQLDNGPTGYRECFSSSCAMVAAFWGKVRSDDEYNRIRAGIGDTTDSQVQIATLRKLGLEARLVTNAAPGLLESEIRAGRPVPVGWYHKGPLTAPTGGGHWSVVVGYQPDHWIHHDPNGEANLISGGYVNHTAGNAVRYSRANWNRRWEADGTGTGWAMLIRPA